MSKRLVIHCKINRIINSDHWFRVRSKIKEDMDKLGIYDVEVFIDGADVGAEGLFD